MAKKTFQSLDLSKAHTTLPELFQHVIVNRGRVQIDGGDGACVLISKEELDALEHAIELLSDSDGVRSMCGALAQVAGAIRPTTGL